jgi:hypothetical protein
VTATDAKTATPPPGKAGGAPAVLIAAAISSLGAGAINAGAALGHAGHRAAVIALAIVAAAQIGWGVMALIRPGRLVSLAGVAVNGVALGGWLLAITNGISFVAGLDTKASPRFPDSVAAGLATVALTGALVALDRHLRLRSFGKPVVLGLVVLVAGLGIPAVALAARQSPAGSQPQASATNPPVPYTGKLPVDLSGVPGVSAQDVADAEALVTATILKLPQFADITKDVALGYRSIGDGLSGWEHFINWAYVDDGRVLDPDYPESIVFKVDLSTGQKTLAAAMFMANPGTTLETVPKIGGALVQWHVHDNLCFRGQPNAWKVAGLTLADGTCRPGTFKLPGGVPMVHVWIIGTPCGPFAALEGIGAGEIEAGQQRLCDTAHGTH